MLVTRWKTPSSPTQSLEVTKDQFWHRLTALPEVTDALFGIASDRASCDDLRCLGQQVFKLLCGNDGDVQFDVIQSACAAQVGWQLCATP